LSAILPWIEGLQRLKNFQIFLTQVFLPFSTKIEIRPWQFCLMPNIRFSFLYRDAANYKTFSDLVFANPEEIPLDTVHAIVRSGCNVDLCFDPVQQFKV
jgi:hypothetical protein